MQPQAGTEPGRFDRRFLVAVLLLFLLPFCARGQGNPAHFHHVHLNVTDPEATAEFYERVFGAVEVDYAGQTPALFTERSFLLMNVVAEEPPSSVESAIWHIGWAGVDGPSEYRYWKEHGVRFQTDRAMPLGDNHYMYMFGPNDELVEIFTGERNHRFNHVHLITGDVNEMTHWLADHLGLEPRRRTVEPRVRGGVLRWSNAVRVDNVSIVIYGQPNPEPPPWWPPEADTENLKPTKGRAVDHIAFSFRDVEPVYERMRTAGVKIVEPLRRSEELATEHFFVEAPDKLLVEVLEAKPLPDAAWE